MTTRQILSICFIAIISQIPTAALWLADSGFFGQPSLARALLNCLTIIGVLPLLRSFPLPCSRVQIAVLIGIVVLLAFLFFQEIPSKISGGNYTYLEKIEVLALGPLAEELFFRGLIWKMFERLLFSLENERWILIITSALFGEYHLGFWSRGIEIQTLQHIVGACLAGLVFGYLRLRSRGLFWPSVSHQLSNAGILLLRLM